MNQLPGFVNRRSQFSRYAQSWSFDTAGGSSGRSFRSGCFVVAVCGHRRIEVRLLKVHLTAHWATLSFGPGSQMVAPVAYRI